MLEGRILSSFSFSGMHFYYDESDSGSAFTLNQNYIKIVPVM